VAARRLLIVLLILLGLSTLAAALVPQDNLNEETTTGGTTQTTPATTTQATQTVPPVEITVGPKKFPLVQARVGDLFTLLVFSRRPREISIPDLGLIGFATAETPARFELLTETAGTLGIVFTASGKAAARIEVSDPSAKKPRKKRGEKGKGARSRARAGSDRA
jgi:hypothetical protein